MEHIFQYNNQDVTFQLGNGDVMVNATQMAKPFGKVPSEYLRLPSTTELLNALRLRNSNMGKSLIDKNELVSTIRGGTNPGTWLHEDIALDFAQWLSIDFKLWCNDRIKELLQKGFTATPDKLEELIQNPDLIITLATQLKAEREEKERLLIDNNRMKPRDEYINKVFESSSLVQLSEAAKLLGLGIGRNTLYAVLREKKMIFQNSTEPIQYYVDKGYFVMKQELKQIPVNGITVPKVTSKTFVTQKGLAYIAKILNVITTNQNQAS